MSPIRSKIILFFVVVLLISNHTQAQSPQIRIQNLILSKSEIPVGMVIGKVPTDAANVIKSNPWIIPRKAMKNIARAIYTNPNPAFIRSMAMTILATKSYPYRDDVVYYAFEFTSARAAQIEIQKLNEVHRNNAQRTILLQGKTTAVFIFSDNEMFFEVMQEIAAKLRDKMY